MTEKWGFKSWSLVSFTCGLAYICIYNDVELCNFHQCEKIFLSRHNLKMKSENSSYNVQLKVLEFLCPFTIRCNLKKVLIILRESTKNVLLDRSVVPT